MMSGSGRVGRGSCLLCQKVLEPNNDSFGDTGGSLRSLFSFYDIGIDDANVSVEVGDLVVGRIASNICEECAFITNAFGVKHKEMEKGLHFMKRCIRRLATGNDTTPQDTNNANALLIKRLIELKVEILKQYNPKQLNARPNEGLELSPAQEKKADDVQVQVVQVDNRDGAQQVLVDGVREAQAACGAQEHGLESGHGQDDAIHNASQENRPAMSNANTNNETAGLGEGERSLSVLSTVGKPTPTDPHARSTAEAEVLAASGSANSDNNDRGQENNGNIIVKVEIMPGQGPSLPEAQSDDGEGDDRDDAQTVALNHTGNRDQDQLISDCESEMENALVTPQPNSLVKMIENCSHCGMPMIGFVGNCPCALNQVEVGEAGPSSRPSQLVSSSVNGEAAAAEPQAPDEVVEVEVPIRVTEQTRQHQNVESDFEKKREFYKTNCRRPPYTYAFLIRKAIRESPAKQLGREDIFAWFKANFRFYQKRSVARRTSKNIGYALTKKSCFVRLNVGEREGVWRVKDREFYKSQTKWSHKRHTRTTSPERQGAAATNTVSEVKVEVETGMNQDEPNGASSRIDEGHLLNLPESETIQGSAGDPGSGGTGSGNPGSRRGASGTSRLRMKCAYCASSFPCKTDLERHLRRVHTVLHFSNHFGPGTSQDDVNLAVRKICNESTTISSRKTGTFHCSLCGGVVRGDTKKDHILKSHLATLVSQLEAARRDLPAGNIDVDMESSEHGERLLPPKVTVKVERLE